MSNPYTVIEGAAQEVYGRGFLDGMAMAFQLILGEQFEEMTPYEGNLNKSAREWVELRLEAVRATRAEA